MSFNTIKNFAHKQNLQELWLIFKDSSQVSKIKKGDALPAPHSGIFGFLEKGLIVSVIECQSKEICIDIFKEGVCFINLEFANVPSTGKNELICIEDSIVHTLNRNQFDDLINSKPELNNPARMVFEHLYVNLKRRLIASYCQSTGKQYEILINKYPELIKRLPKKYLASFLNVSPEALSRVRQKLKNN